MNEVWPARYSVAARPSGTRAAPAKNRNRSTQVSDLVDRGAHRLARVLALEPADLVGRGLERVGDLEEDQAPVLRRRLLPGRERLLRGVDGAVDVLRGARRNLGDDLAVGRVLDVEGLARGGIDELAADELLVGRNCGKRVGHGALHGARYRRGSCRNRVDGLCTRRRRTSTATRPARRPVRRRQVRAVALRSMSRRIRSVAAAITGPPSGSAASAPNGPEPRWMPPSVKSQIDAPPLGGAGGRGPSSGPLRSATA